MQPHFDNGRTAVAAAVAEEGVASDPMGSAAAGRRDYYGKVVPDRLEEAQRPDEETSRN